MVLFLINHPSLEEQTKIANFLTLLDKQIQLIEGELELYGLRKKYYINKIYCDEYSNLRKRRVKNFCDKRLGSNFGSLFDIKPSGDRDMSKFSLNKINYPSREEQTKIANLFSTLDESIQSLQTQKDQLTTRKTYY